jgi:hypothetical protein
MLRCDKVFRNNTKSAYSDKSPKPVVMEGERACAAVLRRLRRGPRVLAIDFALFRLWLERPAAVVPSVSAISPGCDFPVGDARGALNCVIWNVEDEIVLVGFGCAVSVRLCHDRYPLWKDLGPGTASAPARWSLCRRSQRANLRSCEERRLCEVLSGVTPY